MAGYSKKLTSEADVLADEVGMDCSLRCGPPFLCRPRCQRRPSRLCPMRACPPCGPLQISILNRHIDRSLGEALQRLHSRSGGSGGGSGRAKEAPSGDGASASLDILQSLEAARAIVKGGGPGGDL